MNAYDFDNTIYRGDSTVDFYVHCLTRFAGVRAHALSLIGPGLRFVTGQLDKTSFKQTFFSFLGCVPDVEGEVIRFWDKHAHKIKPFYRAQSRPDDIIISASPEFLLRLIIQRLGLTKLIASRVDERTGIYTGLNCHGEEKVLRLRASDPKATIDDFYSDSQSDAPLARIARRAFLVKGDRITPWNP